MSVVNVFAHRGEFLRVLQETERSQTAVMTVAPAADAGPPEIHDADQIVYVAEYWINLAGRVLEVYRRPVRSASARYGWKYRTARVLRPGAAITPLAAPDARITVADLLP